MTLLVLSNYVQLETLAIGKFSTIHAELIQ